MSEVNSKLKIKNSDPSSRSSARELRERVLECLRAQEKVVIDLSVVKSMSDSFADELFAILSLELGLEKFFDQIRIENSTKSVEYVIASNIKNRNSSIVAA